MGKFIKKALIAIGAFFALLIVAFVIFYFLIGKDQDAESKAVAEKMVKSIGSKWDLDTVRMNADAEFLKAVPEGKLRSFLNLFREKLGSIVSVEESKGDSNDYFDITKMHLNVTAKYLVKVKFEKGDGSVTMTLHKVSGVWKIREFRVNSNKLLDLH